MSRDSIDVGVYFRDEQTSQQRRFLSWWVNDPLILAESDVSVDRLVAPGEDEGLSLPRQYDLIITPPGPYLARDSFQREAKGYLDAGGALLFRYPDVGEDPQNAAKFLSEELDLNVDSWADSTPPMSLSTSHTASRILGHPTGTSVYPHRESNGHLRFTDDQHAVTRLSTGDPDLLVSPTRRAAVYATPVLSDLAAHHRTEPNYFTYRENLARLTVNVIRGLLGEEIVNQPIPEKQREWAQRFYALAAGRDYADSLANELDTPDSANGLGQARKVERQAASHLLQGQFEACQEQYESALGEISGVVDELSNTEQYLIRGMHASLLTEEYHLGGLLGYAECEWMDHLMESLSRHYDWLENFDARSVDDLSGRTWDLIDEYYPEFAEETKSVVEEGRMEVVRGLYTQPYLPILSPESNIRQFKHGIESIEGALDVQPEIFLSPRDHFDFHPQLPQLLDGFGYSAAILHYGVIGEVPSMSDDVISWTGLDGSSIDAVPPYEGLHGARDADDLFYSYWWPRPDVSAVAETSDYDHVLFGDSLDATSYSPGEREANIVNPPTTNPERGQVSGQWVTGSELFSAIPEPDSSHYFDADDLYGRNLERWSSFGCLNEGFRWNRRAEARLQTAETFNACATLLDVTDSAKPSLDNAWKKLLASQDHMVFGAVDYASQVPDVDTTEYDESELNHHYGYHLDELPPENETIGWMDNYGEAGSAHYAGPMIPASRYEIGKRWIDEVDKIAADVLEDALTSISNTVDTSFEGESVPLVVFNQQAHQRTKTVHKTVPIPQNWSDVGIVSAAGHPIVADITKQETETGQHVSVSFEATVPGIGFTVYHLVRQTDSPAQDDVLSVSPEILENDYYLVEFDENRGGITRVYDKHLGYEVFTAEDGRLLGEVFAVGEIEGSTATGPTEVEVTSDGPVTGEVTIHSSVKDADTSLRVSLPRTQKTIEFELDVDYGTGIEFGEHEAIGTGLRFAAPLNTGDGIRVNKPFGLYESARKKQYALDLVSVENNSRTATLFHESTPGVYNGDDCLSLTLAQGRPLIVGEETYTFGLYTHEPSIATSSLVHRAESFNTPLSVKVTSQNSGENGKSCSLVEIEDDVLVASLYATNNQSVTTHLYEVNGTDTTSEVEVATEDSYIWEEIELSGQALETLCEGHSCSIELDSHEITSLSIHQ